jgi:hypothetical protein
MHKEKTEKYIDDGEGQSCVQPKNLFIEADKCRDLFIILVPLFCLSYYVFPRVQLTRPCRGEISRFWKQYQRSTDDVTFLETVLEKEGVVVKELTLQGKNVILNRELAAFELKAFTRARWLLHENKRTFDVQRFFFKHGATGKSTGRKEDAVFFPAEDLIVQIRR